MKHHVIVPLNDYSIEKLKRVIYSKGVLNFIYEIKNKIDSDDDDIVELKDEDDDFVKVDVFDGQNLCNKKDKK